MLQQVAQSHLDALPGNIFIKDTQSRYLYANQAHSQLVGFDNFHSLLDAGGTDYDSPNEAALLADRMIAEDQRVMANNAALKFLKGYRDKNANWHILLGEKKPFHNTHGGIQGVSSNCQNVTDNPLMNFATIIGNDEKRFGRCAGFCYYIAHKSAVFNLSKRQTECLYYLVRGFTAPEIATRLGLSKRTVESHLDETKHKLACNSKSELIAKAIYQGFLSILPPSVLYVV